jgi:anti-sigma regulatory factor (Ser/Thr protein kinase)
MTSPAQVVVKNDFSELEKLSEWVDRFATRHDLSAETAFKAKLALDEVVTNVISYAFADSCEHEIIVRMTIRNGSLSIEVEDDGGPFDPSQVPRPDIDAPLEHRKIGGLGVHLARSVMDRIDYTRQGNRNRLVMKKKVVASS